MPNNQTNTPKNNHLSESEIGNYLRQAQKCFQLEDFDNARRWIDQVIELHPEHQQALSFWKVVDQARKEHNLPYLFPAGLGEAQTVDGVSGLLTRGDISALQFCSSQAKEIAVNIGVFNGLSTYIIAKSNPQIDVYGIDAFMGMNAQLEEKNEEQIQRAKENLAKQKNAQLIIGLSEDVVKEWDKKIDFLLIDGDHSVEGALNDFSLWSPHVSDDGLIAVHDVYRHVSQSIVAVRKMTNNHGPDLICEKMEKDPGYELVLVSGCTEIWRKKGGGKTQRKNNQSDRKKQNQSKQSLENEKANQRRVLSYVPETCLVFVSYGRLDTARRSYESLREAISPFRDKIRIIISDATDDSKKINWARNTDADDLIITPRFTPAATSRNLAMTLIMDKYTPRYLCMVEDDFQYSHDWYPNLVEAAETLYGIRSPYGLAYGIFSGCDHHIPPERQLEDKENNVTAYLFGAVAYQRFTTTNHYLSVMRRWDADLLGISYAQTGGQTFRNTMRGYCGAVLPGALSKPIDLSGKKSTWSKGKRDPGPPPHSFKISDYQAVIKAAKKAGWYTNE